MFMPASIPQLTPEKLREWSKLSFQQLVLEWMSLFISEAEVPRADLSSLIARAFDGFTRQKEDGSLVLDEITLHELHDADVAAAGAGEAAASSSAAATPAPAATPLRSVTVTELWHGPTLAFKDLPLQFLGQLLGYFVTRRRRRVSILVGTSGDTGSAAIEAVRHCPFVDIFVLFPANGRISKLQELQMTTVESEHDNVHVVAVDGSSDELDAPILRICSGGRVFKEQYGICSINSVNVIRVLMQCVHFIYSYLRLSPNVDQLVDFVLPTGAAGHLVAGVMVKKAGLPIGQLCAATNDNSLMATFLSEGRFFPRQEGAIRTCSPAIDIQVPYNVERLLYLMAEGSELQRTSFVREKLQALDHHLTQGFELGEAELARWRSFGLRGASVSQAEVLDAIRQAWTSPQPYLIDPHTAVAVHAARRMERPAAVAVASLPTASRVVVFATAHAVKFEETVRKATGMDQQSLRTVFAQSPFTHVRRALELDETDANYTIFERGDDWDAKLRALIVQAAERNVAEGSQSDQQQQQPEVGPSA